MKWQQITCTFGKGKKILHNSCYVIIFLTVMNFCKLFVVFNTTTKDSTVEKSFAEFLVAGFFRYKVYEPEKKLNVQKIALLFKGHFEIKRYSFYIIIIILFHYHYYISRLSLLYYYYYYYIGGLLNSHVYFIRLRTCKILHSIMHRFLHQEPNFLFYWSLLAQSINCLWELSVCASVHVCVFWEHKRLENV